MTIHRLKIWPKFFKSVKIGEKSFEIRKNDRDFKVGDILVLQEWSPETDSYTGDVVTKKISYILDGGVFGLECGFVCMALAATDDLSGLILCHAKPAAWKTVEMLHPPVTEEQRRASDVPLYRAWEPKP